MKGKRILFMSVCVWVWVWVWVWVCVCVCGRRWWLRQRRGAADKDTDSYRKTYRVTRKYFRDNNLKNNFCLVNSTIRKMIKSQNSFSYGLFVCFISIFILVSHSSLIPYSFRGCRSGGFVYQMIAVGQSKAVSPAVRWLCLSLTGAIMGAEQLSNVR